MVGLLHLSARSKPANASGSSGRSRAHSASCGRHMHVLRPNEAMQWAEKSLALESAETYRTVAGQPSAWPHPKRLGDCPVPADSACRVRETIRRPSARRGSALPASPRITCPKLLLEHRSLSKLKGTYTEQARRVWSQPARPYIPAHFSAVGWPSRRLQFRTPICRTSRSAEEGRRIRAAFIAPGRTADRLWPTTSADRVVHRGAPVGRCRMPSPTARDTSGDRAAESSVIEVTLKRR